MEGSVEENRKLESTKFKHCVVFTGSSHSNTPIYKSLYLAFYIGVSKLACFCLKKKKKVIISFCK